MLISRFDIHELTWILLQNDWVICRVFHKCSSLKRDPFNELAPTTMPPLMDDSSPFVSESSHVHCFSSPIPVVSQKNQEEAIPCFNDPFSANSMDTFTTNSTFSWGQFGSTHGGFQFPGSIPRQDPSILRSLLGNYGQNMIQNSKNQKEMVSVSQETGTSTDINTEISSVVSNHEIGRQSTDDREGPSTSVSLQNLGCVWSY